VDEAVADRICLGEAGGEVLVVVVVVVDSRDSKVEMEGVLVG